MNHQGINKRKRKSSCSTSMCSSGRIVQWK